MGRQHEPDGLENAADLSGDGGTGGDALTVLLDGRLRQAVAIAQQVGPFDNEFVAASSFCSIRARNEQNTWPRIAASLE